MPAPQIPPKRMKPTPPKGPPAVSMYADNFERRNYDEEDKDFLFVSDDGRSGLMCIINHICLTLLRVTANHIALVC